MDYLSKNQQELYDKYLQAKGDFETFFFSSLENYYNCKSLSTRREYIKKCRLALKYLFKNDTKKEWDFYKNVIDEIDKLTLFKKDLQTDSQLRTLDSNQFDCPVYDVYKYLIKSEKANLADSKNKTLFNVSPRIFNILRVRCYAEIGMVDSIRLFVGNNIKQTGLFYKNLVEACYDFNHVEATIDYCKKDTDENSLEYRVKILKKLE